MWNTGGCSSWYLDEHGNNTVLWGGYTWQYWLATRSIKPAEYQFFGVGTGSPAEARRQPSTVALRPALEEFDEGLRGRVHAGLVVGGHEIQQEATDDGQPEPCHRAWSIATAGDRPRPRQPAVDGAGNHSR